MAKKGKNCEYWRNSIEIITIDDDEDDDIVIVDNPVDPLNVSICQNGVEQSNPSTFPSTNGNTKGARITKELTFNGQKKTFVLLNSKTPTAQKQTEPSKNPVNSLKLTGNDYHVAQVQCPRCKNNICVESFREHIDSCHPRKTKYKKAAHNNDNVSSGKKKRTHNFDDGPPDLSDSVYSDFVNEPQLIPGLTYNSKSKKNGATSEKGIFNHMATETATMPVLNNNFTKPVKYTARKSTSSKNQVAKHYSVDLESGLGATDGFKIQTYDKKDSNNIPQRIRSKSCCVGDDLFTNKNDVTKPANGANNLYQNSTSTSASENRSRERYPKNNTDDFNHASQLAYYKKFLEVRHKSGIAKSSQIQETEYVANTKPEVNLNESLEVSLLLEDNTFACSVCSFTTDKQRTLHDHERNHRRTNKKIYRCAYCDQKYTKHALYLHIQNVHPGQKFGFLDDTPIIEITGANEPATLKCLKCSYIPASEADLKDHDKQHKPDATGKFSCNLCSYVTQSQKNMDGHINTHAKYSKDPIKQCTWCEYKTIDRSLRVHAASCRHKPRKIIPARRSLRDRKSELFVNHANSRKSEPFAESKDESMTKPLIKRNTKSLNSFRIQEEYKPKTETPKRKEVNKLNNAKIIQYTCDLCSFSSPNKFGVQKLHRDSHKFQPIVKCDKCEFQSTPRCVHRHQETCSKKAKIKTDSFEIKQSLFKCLQCKFTTSLRIKLNSHLKKCHSSITDEEGYLTRRQNSLDSFQCMKCPFKAVSQIDLNSHIKKQHVTLFQCGNCCFFTLERAEFNKHINSHNPKNAVNKCGKCCYKSTKSYLTAHLKIHDNIGERSEDGTFKCELCSHVSRSQGKLERHRQSHNTNPFQKCPLCFFKSTHVCVLRHLKHSHKINFTAITSVTKLDAPEKDFEKDIWRRSSSVGPPKLESMDISEDIKKPDVKVNCEFSSEVFKAVNVLTKQVNDKPNSTNSKVSPFKCEFCSAVFMVQNGLNRHISIHRKKTPMIKCQFCDFVSALRQVQTHEVFCPGKLSRQEKGLQSPKSQEFCCNMCVYSTKLRIKLKMHLKTKHSVSDSSPVKEMDSTLLSSDEPPKKRRRTENKGEEKLPKKGTLFDNTKVRTRSKSVGEVKKKVSEPKLSLPSDSCVNRFDINISTKGSHCCSICSYSTNTKAGLISHLSGHKNFNNPILQCHYCGIKGTDNFIKKHVCSTEKIKRLITPMKVRLDCDKCSFTTYFPLDFFEHQTSCTATKSGKNIGAIKSFKCKFCSFTSFWQYLFERHLDSHTVLKLPIEQCPNCDFHSTPVALMAHKNKCIKREK